MPAELLSFNNSFTRTVAGIWPVRDFVLPGQAGHLQARAASYGRHAASSTW